MTKNSKYNLWLFMALAIVSGCGPIAPSVSKIGAPTSTTSSVSSSDSSSALSFVSVHRGASDLSDITAQGISAVTEQVKFVSGLKPSQNSRGPSPIDQILSEPFYSQLTIASGNRIEINSDNSLVAEIKEGQNLVTFDASALDDIDGNSKIHILIEMARPQNQIPSEDLLPSVAVNFQRIGRTGQDRNQRMTLNFSEVSDPTAETRTHLLHDVSRIYVFLSKE